MSILIGSICFLVPIGSSSLSKGKATAEGGSHKSKEKTKSTSRRQIVDSDANEDDEDVNDIGNNKYR
jgi:hypothetical protein